MMAAPQFVVVVSFPAMSTARERRTALARGLALVAVLGAACVGGTLVLPRLALAFAGGPAYLEIEPYIWLFALLGTAMSMLQLLVYAVSEALGHCGWPLSSSYSRADWRHHRWNSWSRSLCVKAPS